MATFSPAGRINLDGVTTEIARLHRLWSGATPADDQLDRLLTPEQQHELDPFDRVQLAHVVTVCRASRTLSDAGRTLFAASLRQRSSTNDADRLRKYLARFALSWGDVTATPYRTTTPPTADRR
jgi:transcriptional regulatory protein RtcR